MVLIRNSQTNSFRRVHAVGERLERVDTIRENPANWRIYSLVILRMYVSTYTAIQTLVCTRYRFHTET